MVKNLPRIAEDKHQEDPLEKKRATHSRILTWESPWSEEPGMLQFMGSQRVRHNFATTQQQLLQPKNHSLGGRGGKGSP